MVYHTILTLEENFMTSNLNAKWIVPILVVPMLALFFSGNQEIIMKNTIIDMSLQISGFGLVLDDNKSLVGLVLISMSALSLIIRLRGNSPRNLHVSQALDHPPPPATQKTAVPVLAYQKTVTLAGSTFKFTHPLASSEGIEYLISCAQMLISYNPSGRVFSLGQSPAWIVKTANLIETSTVTKKLNTTPSRFNGIAYSGTLFKEKYQWAEPMPTITPAQKASYREYLQGLHLDPSSIIKSGKPVTIVEHTHSGKGLFSFLRFIQDWARGSEWESYKKLIKIHFLKSEVHSLPIKISGCFKHSVQIIKHKFITNLTNADDFDDRLLPRYQTYKWGTLDAHPEFCKNLSASSKDIIAKIVLHLEDDFDHNHGNPPSKASIMHIVDVKPCNPEKYSITQCA
jgi:hypothetical protein